MKLGPIETGKFIIKRIKHRLFINVPMGIYEALERAVKQNYCTKTTYIIRSLMNSFQRDGIDINRTD